MDLALQMRDYRLTTAEILYHLPDHPSVLKASGVIGQDLAYTALVAGAALLLLSAFWHRARQIVLLAIPAGLRQRLPSA